MTDLVARAKKAYHERGIYYVLAEGAKIVNRKIHVLFAEAYYRLVGRGRSFVFEGETYPYLYRRYNTTFWNERSVEVPIVWRIVKSHTGRILEVGNVLSHYFPCRHDVLDKYERGKDIINCDVVDFKPSNRYDLIVSISTLEHVGFRSPEEPDPKKILQALANLRENCLRLGGEILVTLPAGENPSMDRLLYDGKLGFVKLSYLKRISRDNRWMETDATDAANATCGFPFRGVNAIIVGVIR
jgi:hypothetical protein